MARHEMVGGLEPLQGRLPTYIPCKVAKSTRSPYLHSPGIRSKSRLELIHSDICSPAPVTSLGGAKYYITFLDDFTRKIAVYTMAKKNQALECFIDFQRKVETETGQKIKSLRMDNGLEYCNEAFHKLCQDKGMKHERTNIY